MSRRNYAVIIALILTLFCCGLTGFAAAKDGPPVSMEVSSIYDGIGKMGVHVPISVRLYAGTESSFSGTLAVQTLENGAEEGEEVYEYHYPVELDSAETRVMDLYIPIGQRSSEIHVILKHADGTLIQSETMRFDVSRDMGRLLIGVLSDKAEKLDYFDGVSLDYGMVQSRTILLDETTLPADVKGLELLDVLVLTHFETDRLSEVQTAVISEWVENGGTLLIGTGATVYSTLGSFAEGLVELPIEGIFYENINLGTEYAQKAPGDAEVNMACAELTIPDGVVIEESDGIPLITSVKRGKGQICVYTYCLDEITEFVEKNPNYAAQMLTNVLGEDVISRLYYYSSYGADEDYWNAYSLVNAGSAERLPNLLMYGIVIVLYLAAAGPGLYLFLKKKELSRIYGTTVVVTSAVVSMIIYLMGVGTRFTSQFFQVATVMDLEGVTVEETSYLNVRTPDSRPFVFTIPNDYDVTALTRSNRYNEQAVAEFERSKEGDVLLQKRADGTRISGSEAKAFEPKFFKLKRTNALVSEGNIVGNLQWFDGKLSGTLENHLPFALEDAALVFYGQLYRIGDLASGEVLTFDEEEMSVWPVGMSYVASEAIIGGTDEEHSDQEYLEENGRKSLYSYYLGEQFESYTPEVRLIAIGPSGGLLSEPVMMDQIADGTVLYSAKVNISSGDEELVYRSAMKHEPEVTSGSGAIYGDGLAMYGTEPIVVEYFLGEEMRAECLSFLPVSEMFLNNSEYYYIKQFDGTAHFYNHTTGSYDRVDLSKADFTAEELRPYLSQKNSITVKYTAGENGSYGNTLLLPHLMVTGREG